MDITEEAHVPETVVHTHYIPVVGVGKKGHTLLIGP